MNAVGIGMVELLIVLGLGGGTGLSLGMPPAPEDPLLAQAAPDECLFYTMWTGTAEPDPASKNQTEQLLAEPEIRALAAEIERIIGLAAQRATGPDDSEQAAMAADALRWGKKLLRSPTAVFVATAAMGEAGPDVRGGALVRVGKEDATALGEALAKYRKLLPPEAVETVPIDGVDFHRVTLSPEAPKVTLGVRGNYLIVGVGDGSVEGILERAKTPVPAWLAKLRKQLPVQRTAAVSYINVKKTLEIGLPLVGNPELPKIIEALGLSNVGALASVSGLDDEGMISRSLLALDGPARGLLGLADVAPLKPADLAPIPADATIAAAVRVDASQVLNVLMALLAQVDPRSREELIQGLNEIREKMGVDVQGDLLASLGDVWRFYNSPGEGGLVITGLTAVVSVKDPKRLADAHARLLAAMKAESERGGDRGPRVEQFEFAGQTIYFFNARAPEFPLAPAWCLTGKELIAATFPQNIKAYLSRGADFESLAKVPAVASAMAAGGGPFKFAYVDVPTLFEMVYPLVPVFAQLATSEMGRQGIDVNVSIIPSAPAIGRHLRPTVMAARRTEAGIEWTSRQTAPGGNIGASAPVAVALLLPAVQSARAAARRAQSMNNLKQIGLAMHVHHNLTRHFPPAYTADKDGKPLLSWRVLILPYIEQEALYKQFHLDEPWDSEHNKTLIPLMPQIYASPGSTAGPEKTDYLTVRGERTAFPGAEGIRFDQIRDGMSATIMAVEASDANAVIWTKPDDFPYDEKDPAAGLTGLRPGGFNAAFCDGSVRFINANVAVNVLRSLMLRDDGGPVDWDWIDGQ